MPLAYTNTPLVVGAHQRRSAYTSTPACSLSFPGPGNAWAMHYPAPRLAMLGQCNVLLRAWQCLGNAMSCSGPGNAWATQCPTVGLQYDNFEKNTFLENNDYDDHFKV